MNKISSITLICIGYVWSLAFPVSTAIGADRSDESTLGSDLSAPRYELVGGDRALWLIESRNDDAGGEFFIGSDEVFIKPTHRKHKFPKVLASDMQDLPEKYALLQNYPNPFNPETEIRFQIPEAEIVGINIYNMLGQEVRSFSDMVYEAVYHSIRWDGLNETGNPVCS